MESNDFTLRTARAKVYEGDMLDEQKHGMGEYHYADGTEYCGGWYRGQRQGFGMLVAPDGASYEGELYVCTKMMIRTKYTAPSCRLPDAGLHSENKLRSAVLPDGRALTLSMFTCR